MLKAARLLGERVPGLKIGDFTLDKVLPVAAGIGGGSADAAAALRLLARLNGLALDDARLIEVAPADRRRRAGLSGLARLRHDRRRRNACCRSSLPKMPCVLVNPRVPVATKDVFAALGLRNGELAGRASPT